MLEQITIWTLGLLGGVLSPALVEAIKRKRETTAVLSAVKTELNEVGFRLVLASYSIEQHLGTTDRSFLKWVQDSMVVYHGDEPTENIATYISAQLSWTDEQLAIHVANEAAQGVKALTVPKFAIPFSDANVPGWHAIPPSVRLGLLAIHTDIELINDAVDQTRNYFNLTFTKLESNHETVAQNLRGAYRQYGKRCRLAAQRMQRLYALL
ncbi:MAG: hypothetical protein IPG93_08215 [Burkholderiales bacterium]|nr:hypothetical protein [Burkholderiales bacterium]